MTGWKELKKLPRELWLLNFANVINRMGTMAFLFFGLYLTRHLGYPAKVAGFLLGTFGFGSLVITPFGGWLCDRFGPKRILVMSLGLSGTLLLIFPLVKGLPNIFGLTILIALIGECFGPAFMTYSTAALPSELKKTSVALSRLSHNLGMSVGPVLGGFFAAISFKWVFWVDGVTSLLAFLILLLCLPEKKVKSENEPPSYIESLGWLAKDRRLGYFILASVPLGIASFQFNTTLPIFLSRDLGIHEAQYGFLFTINTLMIVGMELPLTVRISKWRASRVLALSSIFYGVGYFVLPFTKGYLGVVVMVVVTTLGEMLMAPSGAAYVSEISPRGREGSYMGLFTAAFSLSLLIAPILGTWSYDLFGGLGLWGITFGLCLLSSLLFLRIQGASG